jgi:hypothetical protein
VAFVRASGFISCLFESCSKAFEAFLLVVFCEIIVATRVLNGSSEDLAHVESVKVFFSFRRMLWARFLSVELSRLFKVINSECMLVLISDGEFGDGTGENCKRGVG